MVVQTIKDNHMKKSILTLMIASTFGISIADYRIAMPMEVQNGGGLQNGSISFTGGTPPVEEPEVPVTPPAAKDECMPLNVGVYVWRVNKNTGAGTVIWNGTTVGSIVAGSSSLSGANGIVYTRNESSAAVPQGPQNLQSGVCRNIPGNFNGGSWVSIAPVVTAWTNSGSAYNCTWTPDSNNYLPSQSVDQTGINCKQKQVSTSQAREQNDSTLDIRNVGSPTNLNRDIDSDENPTRTIAGTDMTTAPETCGYDRLSGWYWAVSITENQTSYVSWKGTQVFDYQNSPQVGNATQITVAGITYKRSTFQDGDSNTSNYALCRVNK
jgi:hypothetical protein